MAWVSAEGKRQRELVPDPDIPTLHRHRGHGGGGGGGGTDTATQTDTEGEQGGAWGADSDWVHVGAAQKQPE